MGSRPTVIRTAYARANPRCCVRWSTGIDPAQASNYLRNTNGKYRSDCLSRSGSSQRGSEYPRWLVHRPHSALQVYGTLRKHLFACKQDKCEVPYQIKSREIFISFKVHIKYVGWCLLGCYDVCLL
jgi:hypothetical protein